MQRTLSKGRADKVDCLSGQNPCWQLIYRKKTNNIIYSRREKASKLFSITQEIKNSAKIVRMRKGRNDSSQNASNFDVVGAQPFKILGIQQIAFS